MGRRGPGRWPFDLALVGAVELAAQIGAGAGSGERKEAERKEGRKEGGETSSGPGVPAPAYIALPCKYTM